MAVYYADGFQDEEYLEHYGIRGMKWGIRNYQYQDGSLTPEGKERYGYGKGERTKKQVSRTIRDLNAQDREMARIKGDISQASGRYKSAVKKGNTVKAAKYSAKLKLANQNLKQMQKNTDKLIKNAKIGDMPISKLSTWQDAWRVQDYLKTGTMATAMALPMAMISPVGFGVGFGWTDKTDVVKGTKYIHTNPNKRRGTKL